MAGGDAPMASHFWGVTLPVPTAPYRVSLLGTELHITQVLLAPAVAAGAAKAGGAPAPATAGKAGKGGDRVVVTVRTAKVSTPLPIASLTPAAPSALLDVDFFEGDEWVEVELRGGVDAAAGEKWTVTLAGAAAVHAVEEGSDASDGEELPPAIAGSTSADVEAPEGKPAAASGFKRPRAFQAAEADEEEEEEDEDDEDDEGEEEESGEEEEEAPQPPARAAAKAPAPATNAKAAKAAAPAGAKAAASASDKPAAKANGNAASAGSGDPPVESMAGGKLRYQVLAKGSGARPRPGQKLTVSYEGRLSNGKSFDRSSAFHFKLGKGEVIKGWDIGFSNMAVGEKRRLYIHPSLGYGARGSPPVIPGNSTLIFDVQLLGAK